MPSRMLCSSDGHWSWHGAVVLIVGLVLSGVLEVDGTCLLTLPFTFRFGSYVLEDFPPTPSIDSMVNTLFNYQKELHV